MRKKKGRKKKGKGKRGHIMILPSLPLKPV